ncbi:TetR/AcrR family transcriptional regulator [Schaalia cardiffensis]|uniref:TetR/AcrR family transcriptional regulator n=1 Tax=Schaalia cardiffensis TaxID=181487 RepID=UPI0023F0FCDB|nr:TetR/AcrR family transcriptional regulator [Schaalia cardiffensis]
MGNRIDTQERLIAATRHIIIEEGMEATSLEHICKTAGFTRGAFYSNFASKDSLLAALAEDEYTGLIERLRLTIDHWASSSSFVEEDGVEASGELLIENLLFEALDAIGTNRELHLLHTELLLRSIRDPEWAKRFLDINLEFVDELGRSLEWILEAAGRELTHPLRALTHSVIGVVMRASGVAAWRESMQALRLQEGTTKFVSSPADSIPASSLHHVQASAQNVELSQGLRSESEDSARASGAREILETVLHLLYASSRPRLER